jgi:hypothetical protein
VPYPFDLICRVIAVSTETVKIVRGLPQLAICLFGVNFCDYIAPKEVAKKIARNGSRFKLGHNICLHEPIHAI